LTFDANGQVLSSTPYVTPREKPQNPRSTAWNVELDRQLLDRLVVRVGYQQRNTSRDFRDHAKNGADEHRVGAEQWAFNNYREFQSLCRYQLGGHLLNAFVCALPRRSAT